jgi:nucleoside phosphorylase
MLLALALRRIFRYCRAMSSPEAERAAQLASHVDFGIVTALTAERAAVLAMLDAPVPYVASGRGAGRTYDLGEIRSLTGGTHTVAVALAGMGNNIAATRGSLLLEHFEQVDAILMVGIAGGVPSPEKPEAHVRLGDVVVSEGIVQFDFVKKARRNVEHRHPPRPACARLLESFSYLVADELTGMRPWETHVACGASIRGATRPAATTDLLASTAEPTKSVAHPPDPQRREGLPRIFRGMIGSSGTLLKDARERDRLRDKFGIRAVEMEASGIADATWTHGVGFIAIRESAITAMATRTTCGMYMRRSRRPHMPARSWRGRRRARRDPPDCRYRPRSHEIKRLMTIWTRPRSSSKSIIRRQPEPCSRESVGGNGMICRRDANFGS